VTAARACPVVVQRRRRSGRLEGDLATLQLSWLRRPLQPHAGRVVSRPRRRLRPKRFPLRHEYARLRYRIDLSISVDRVGEQPQSGGPNGASAATPIVVWEDSPREARRRGQHSPQLITSIAGAVCVHLVGSWTHSPVPPSVVDFDCGRRRCDLRSYLRGRLAHVAGTECKKLDRRLRSGLVLEAPRRLNPRGFFP
jgi:hypothetical protein